MKTQQRSEPAGRASRLERLVGRWDVYRHRHRERRHGWPIYLWPSVHVTYSPECEGDFGDVEPLCIGAGCYWLKWHLWVTAIRRAPNAEVTGA